MRSFKLRSALFFGAASFALLTGCDQQTRTPAETTAAPQQQAAAEDINAAFDMALDEIMSALLAADPSYATYLGVSEDEAGGRYKDRFATPGLAGHQEARALTETTNQRLQAFDRAALTSDRQEYLDILLSGVAAQNQAHAIADEHGYVLAGGFTSPYIVTQIGGVHVDLPQFMTQIHPLKTEDDAEAYIARLNLFDEQFGGAAEILRANAEAGALPPDYALDRALQNVNGFVAGPADENILVTYFDNVLDGAAFENEKDLREGVRDAVANAVYPAYQNLAATIEELRPQATHDAGIWDIPGGDDLYDVLIQVNGENTLNGEGVHALGLAEVTRIQAEMEAIFDELEITEGSIGERLLGLTLDPEQVFPNTPEGKEELLEYVRALAYEAEDVMAEYFLEIPSIGFEVRRVPEYAEDGAPGGYYNGPSEDGSRPGLYFINLRDTATQPRWSLPTLTYHEAIPGHHFQIALGTDAKDTPLIVRQNATSTAMAEGWALYSERFAWEIGMYKDDRLGNLGRLRDELFRAVRLVVDSGMHFKRWSREEAITYMVANAGMEESDVRTEIERYSVWPAQALAYKTGMLKVQDLRQRAESALGEDFSLPVFHYEVLRGGGAPLVVLEKRIDAWLTAGGQAPDLN